MNETLKDLRRLVRRHNAILDEDSETHNSRVFQVCPQPGYLWDGELSSFRVEWWLGDPNDDTFADIKHRLESSSQEPSHDPR